MSAICGVLRFDGTAVSNVDLERQINAMSRRGPDRRRTFCDGALGLGHALMRVTEEDSFDDQPLVDRAARIALVADLRLDNREDLAKALAIGERSLHRLPDSALLLRAYKAWGEDCAEHLLGDFAFAIWDAAARKLVMGRDHMGARCIHYYRDRDFFVFATEMKGLWAIAGVPQRLDEFEVGRLLTADLSEPRGTTHFAGIRGMRPATVMTIAADGAERSGRYWTPQPDPRHVGRDETYYIETYRKVLQEAVDCRLRRNVRPSGMLLSGGFDSAAVAALAKPAVSARKRKLIAAASVMPPGQNDVRNNARRWVEACERHMPHLDVRYVTREGAGLLDGLEDHFDKNEGHATVDRIAKAAMLRVLAEAGANVVADGMGGDYTLNSRARGWLSEQLANGRLRLFVSELLAYRLNRDLPFWTVIKQEVIKPLLPEKIAHWLSTRHDTSKDEPIAPTSPDLAQRIRARGAHLRFKLPKSGAGGYYGRQLAVLVHEQGKTGNATHMAAAQYGLEYVQPFHDKRVVELGLAIPPTLIVRGGRNRYLARRAMGDLYPPELRVRPDGNDLRTPDVVDLAKRAQTQVLAEIKRMEGSPRLRRYFDFSKMRNMVEEAIADPTALTSERRLRVCLRSFFMARFIEWVERDNRSGREPANTEPGMSDDESSDPESRNDRRAGTDRVSILRR